MIFFSFFYAMNATFLFHLRKVVHRIVLYIAYDPFHVTPGCCGAGA